MTRCPKCQEDDYGYTASGERICDSCKRIAELEAFREDAIELRNRAIRERDEARAACAAKDEALRFWLDSHRCPYSAPCGQCFACKMNSALSHQAGSELLARLEKAEAFKKYVHERLDRYDVPENPEPEGNKAHGCRIEGRLNWLFLDTNRIRAQLEAMRAALELALKEPAGAYWNGTAIAAMRAALSPDAPRLYRDSVVDECVNTVRACSRDGRINYIESRLHALKSKGGGADE